MWLIEDPWPPMLICVAAAVAALAWWSSSRRSLGIWLATVAILAAGLTLVIDAAVVTPSEAVQQLTVEICEQFRRKDPATLDHFAPQAAGLRAACQGAMQLVTVGDDMRVTDVRVTMSNRDSRAVCQFRVNATFGLAGAGNMGRQPARFELTWARQGTTWKIQNARRLNPVTDDELPLLLPGHGG